VTQSGDSIQTGTAAIELWSVPPDITGTLTANGQATGPLVTTVPGQLINYSYTNNQQTTVALVTQITLNPPGSCASKVAVTATGSNSPVISDLICGGADLSARTTLSQLGTYGISVVPVDGSYNEDTALMNATLALYSVIDLTGSVLANGKSNSYTTTTPEQYVLASLSNSNTASTVAIATSISNETCDNTLVLTPTGGTLYNQGYCGAQGTSFYTGDLLLSQPGTYTVELQPGGMGPGAETITVYPVKQSSGRISAVGTPLTLTGPNPAENYLATFVPSSTKTVTLTSQTSFNGFSVNVTNGTGNQLYYSSPSSNSDTSTALTLSAGSTYSVLIEPSSPASGSATVTLNNAGAQVMPHLSADAGSPTVSEMPGGLIEATFSGAKGARLALLLDTGDANPGADHHCFGLTIIAPDGVTQVYNQPEACGSDFTGVLSAGQELAAALPQSGVYTVTYKSLDPTPFRPRFTLYAVPADIIADSDPSANSSPAVTTVPGQGVRSTFHAEAKQQIHVGIQTRFESPKDQCARLSILDPDGQLALGQQVCGSSAAVGPIPAQKTGTYTAVLEPEGTTVGVYNIRVND